jgi:hypothetical protein
VSETGCLTAELTMQCSTMVEKGLLLSLMQWKVPGDCAPDAFAVHQDQECVEVPTRCSPNRVM